MYVTLLFGGNTLAIFLVLAWSWVCGIIGIGFALAFALGSELPLDWDWNWIGIDILIGISIGIAALRAFSLRRCQWIMVVLVLTSILCKAAQERVARNSTLG